MDGWSGGGGACGWEGKGVGVGCEGMGGVLAQLFVLEPLIAPTEGLRQLRSEFLVLGLFPFNWLDHTFFHTQTVEIAHRQAEFVLCATWKSANLVLG